LAAASAPFWNVRKKLFASFDQLVGAICRLCILVAIGTVRFETVAGALRENNMSAAVKTIPHTCFSHH
jgi:hypothetical protein